MSKFTSASSSSSEDCEDCFGFVELVPYELSPKDWVVDATEDDD